MAAVTYVAYKYVLNVLVSPLASVPGPFLAKLTGATLLLNDLAGNRARFIDAAHERHGRVVRIGPKELSFSGVEAMKDIYDGRCAKSPAYNNFGRRGVFNMQDPEEHRQRLKLLRHLFVFNVLLDMQPLFLANLDRLITELQERLNRPVDMLYWFRMFTLDNGGDVLLSKSFNAISGDQPPEYLESIDNAFLAWAIAGTFPYLHYFLKQIPYKPLQHFLAEGDHVYEHGALAVQEYFQTHGRTSTPSTPSLLTKILHGDSLRSVPPLPDTDVIDEVSNLLLAATDTTGSALSYLFYQLAVRPDWQQALRTEIRGAREVAHQEQKFPSRGTDFLDYAAVQSLPTLEAVLQETLRLYPVVPSSLLRITPPSGYSIDGIFVPGGTVVSSQATTQQRLQPHFPNADVWNPGRWLSASIDGSDALPDNNTKIKGPTPSMHELMMVWGKGTRQCLGMNMAKIEIKLTVAALVERFEVRLADERVKVEMEWVDHFIIEPKGRKCRLVFEKVM